MSLFAFRFPSFFHQLNHPNHHITARTYTVQFHGTSHTFQFTRSLSTPYNNYTHNIFGCLKILLPSSCVFSTRKTIHGFLMRLNYVVAKMYESCFLESVEKKNRNNLVCVVKHSNTQRIKRMKTNKQRNETKN